MGCSIAFGASGAIGLHTITANKDIPNPLPRLSLIPVVEAALASATKLAKDSSCSWPIPVTTGIERYRSYS